MGGWGWGGGGGWWVPGETSALKVMNKVKASGLLATFPRNMLRCVLLWNMLQHVALCCVVEQVAHARLNVSMTLRNKEQLEMKKIFHLLRYS